jgi:hypothetical protein
MTPKETPNQFDISDQFENNWNYQTIANNFKDADITYISTYSDRISETEFKIKPKALSNEQILFTPIGVIDSDQGKHLYGLEVFKENDRSFYIRGEIPAKLNQILLENGIKNRVGSDNVDILQKEGIYSLQCVISSRKQLKTLVLKTKEFYNESLKTKSLSQSPQDNDLIPRPLAL